MRPGTGVIRCTHNPTEHAPGKPWWALAAKPVRSMRRAESVAPGAEPPLTPRLASMSTSLRPMLGGMPVVTGSSRGDAEDDNGGGGGIARADTDCVGAGRATRNTASC